MSAVVEKYQAGLSRYFDSYDRRRPHSTLDGKTPDAAGILPAQEGSGETLSVLDVNGRFVGTVGFDRFEGIRSPQ